MQVFLRKLKRGAEEMVVPKGSTKSPDYPRLVQLLKVAGRSGLYHPLNKADIKMMLTFGSKEQHTNGGITSFAVECSQYHHAVSGWVFRLPIVNFRFAIGVWR